MKRMAAFVLACAMMLTASLALGEAMWVNNTGKWDDRLNLRVEPDRAASSLGRYYTGTRVEGIEDLGEWRYVLIASGVSGSEAKGMLLKGEWMTKMESCFRPWSLSRRPAE